jgi:hypothetical protein
MFVLRIEPVEQCTFCLSSQPLVIPNGIASKGAIQVSAGLLNRDGQSVQLYCQSFRVEYIRGRDPPSLGASFQQESVLSVMDKTSS